MRQSQLTEGKIYECNELQNRVEVLIAFSDQQKSKKWLR